PQVVCYRMPFAKLMGFLKKRVLKVRFVSLVNLIANREVVKELVANKMTVEAIEEELKTILYDKVYRQKMLEGYDKVAEILGPAGASEHAATQIVSLMSSTTH
ncbi:MAG: lipid-A-disaccharide synthase, partial [Bacteroidaceae bacterium]